MMKKRQVTYAMRSAYSPYAEARPRRSDLSEQTRFVDGGTLTIAQPYLEENHRAKFLRAITWALLSLVLLVALAWTRSELSRQATPDWKPVLALADTARAKGDLYAAKSLYPQVERLAAWRDDWAGLLAAACGVKELDRERGRYSATNAVLLRAMVAAETRQSRSGMAAIAKAFAALEEDEVAAMVSSRIRTNWVEETSDSADVVSSGCW